MTQDGIHIGQLAKALGTSTKTLRYYEGMGLIKPSRRSASAYRLYDDAAAARARMVVDLRHLGLSIHELQELLRPGRETTLRQRLLALMDGKLSEIYLKLSVLQGQCDDLSARHAALLATPRARPPECVCDALFRPCTCR
jgi:DNA-binding transcriptional MerR regulator